jgi:electron transfer flavoprotein alpha subunit
MTMENVGIIIECDGDNVKKTNYGVITLARRQSTKLIALMLNGNGNAHQKLLQEYGIEKIVDIVSKEGHIKWNGDTWARAIIDAMNHFNISTLLGLTSPQGKDVLPRIAAVLNAPLVMDCMDVDLSLKTATTSQFSGKTIAIIKLKGRHKVYGIRPNAIEPKAAPAASADVISFETDVQDDGLIVKEMLKGSSGGVDLSEADIIISGGRGMGVSESFDILFKCAEVMGAAVGASRVAVDAGWVPYTMQVGQTGATVSPKVYIACGISGSVQHFAGMKTSGIIIAINKDPEANIMKNCDYYIVADLFEIVPLLTQKLKAAVGQD